MSEKMKEALSHGLVALLMGLGLTLPLLGLLAAVCLMCVLFGIYFAVYLLCTPPECLTPDQWIKIWRVVP